MKFSERIKAFAKTIPGFIVFAAIFVFLEGVSLAETGLAFGAVTLVILFFGLPVYLGWKTPLRNLWVMGAVMLVLTAPIAGYFLTDELVAPYGAVGSSDNLLQNASVNPFESTPSGAPFNFSVEVFPGELPTNGTLRVLSLWVTDCPADNLSYSSSGWTACGGSPDFHTVYNFTFTPAEMNESHFTVFHRMTLNAPQIYYWIIVAQFTYPQTANGQTTLVWGASETCVGGGSTDNLDCTYPEGPVSGSFDAIYKLVLPGMFLVMGELGLLLVLVLLVYTYLKVREAKRKAKAKEAAQGIAGTSTSSSTTERTCPKCQAVVASGETFCWKCGATLDAPSPAPLTTAPSPSADAPLASSTDKKPPSN